MKFNAPTFGRAGSRSGSVLMEMVIAIPIYLVVIGATLWMGELNLSRQRLLTADRFAAWNKGNRHGGAGVSGPNIEKEIFAKSADVSVKKVLLKSKDSDWYRQVTAVTLAKISMPAWTRGMISAGVVDWDAPLQAPHKSETMSGRMGPHLIVMRGGSRNEDKSKVNWISVLTQKWWPMMGGKMGGGKGAGKIAKFAVQDNYDRFKTFVDWSN